MVFSSPLFLFLFLPVVLAVYVALPRALWNGWLLIASLIFYAWGEKFFVGVMLASIAMNYLFGLLVEKWRGTRALPWLMTVAVGSNLSLLVAYKYANFLVDALNKVLPRLHLHPIALAPVHLPIGISFFTFHALSYVVDVYRQHARAQRDPVKIALYIALFPQLIAGPILRFHEITGQIDSRRLSLSMVSDGVRRFIVGLAKKTLLANLLAGPADQIFTALPSQISVGAAWLGAACYTMQIYFDFSGYSDMALGLGKMFGFSFPENFNYPYVSQSIREFWQRWHISLSTWFRDYLYIPIGGNRVSGARHYFNLLVVFLLCGFWHGASWTFLFWGLYHGAFLIFERLVFARGRSMRPAAIAHIYTLLVVMVGWVFFRADNFTHALHFLERMGGFGKTGTITVTALQFSTHDVEAAFFAGLVACTSLPAALLLETHRRALEISTAARGLIESAHVAGLAVMFLLSLFQLAAGTYNPFIYFRF